MKRSFLVIPRIHQPTLLSAPLLGPSLGPILGGALTQGFNWRATFWFLSILIGTILVVFIFFKDTFRRERSLTYQRVLQRVRTQREAAPKSETSTLSHVTAVNKKIDGIMHTKKTSEAAEKSISARQKDIEAQTHVSPPPTEDVTAEVKEIKLSLTDVNPIPPLLNVLSRFNNVAILFSSGWHFIIGQ